MIAAFAGYLVLVSVLFAVAAWATDQALSVRRWPRRFLWILTLAASVAFPTGMTLIARPAAHTILAMPPTELGFPPDGRDAAMPPQREPSGQLSFATGADFGVFTGVEDHGPFSPLILLKVTSDGPNAVKITLRAPEAGPTLLKSAAGDPATWTQMKQLDVAYGQALTAEFSNGNQIVLRAERLKQ